MKKPQGNSKSSMEGQKATLSSTPKSAGRHRCAKMKPASGHAMKGGKFRK